jgi:hypothetical protein
MLEVQGFEIWGGGGEGRSTTLTGLKNRFSGQFLKCAVPVPAKPHMAVLEAEEGNWGDGKAGCLECILMLSVDVADKRKLKASDTNMRREVVRDVVPLAEHRSGS